MKKFKKGLGMVLMLSMVMTSCSKEEDLDGLDQVTEDSEFMEPSKTELITGSYSIVFGVFNGDTLDPNAQWMDQTYVINADGTGAQLLHVTQDSVEYTFTKPLEWYFNESEDIWNSRTKDLDDEGNAVEVWGDWIPASIYKLTENEFWYGLSYPDFSFEFRLEKIE